MRKGGFDMETKKMVKEILNALKLHSKHMDQKFKKWMKFEQIDERFKQMDERFDLIEGRLDRMEKKWTVFASN